MWESGRLKIPWLGIGTRISLIPVQHSNMALHCLLWWVHPIQYDYDHVSPSITRHGVFYSIKKDTYGRAYWEKVLRIGSSMLIYIPFCSMDWETLFKAMYNWISRNLVVPLVSKSRKITDMWRDQLRPTTHLSWFAHKISTLLGKITLEAFKV